MFKEVFQNFLSEGVKVPKNLNAKLEKAGFDGMKTFKDENDSFAELSKVLATGGLGVDFNKWTKMIANEESGVLPVNSLDEYGKKVGSLKNKVLEIALEKLDRNQITIYAELVKKS